jgi:hypothetical protein
MTILIYLCLAVILPALYLVILFTRELLRRRRFMREYAHLSKLFESSQWPEPGAIAKGEVKR